MEKKNVFLWESLDANSLIAFTSFKPLNDMKTPSNLIVIKQLQQTQLLQSHITMWPPHTLSITLTNWLILMWLG